MVRGKEKWPKKKKLEALPSYAPVKEKQGKLLDGFLLLYSCRVKLPHEAI